MLKGLQESLAELKDLDYTSYALADEYILACRAADNRQMAIIPRRNLYVRTTWKLLWVKFLNLFSSKNTGKLRYARWIKTYFSDYFFTKGITKYKTRPFPTNTKKPLLIVTTRMHAFSALFAYTLFDTPILIPLLDIFKQYLMFPKFKFSPIRKRLPMISYSDISLNTAWPELRKLLQDGHNVLVHLNQDIHHPTLRDRLQMYATLKEIITDPDLPAELYFLNLDGFERYPRAHILSPIHIRCDLQTPEEVYGALFTDTVEEKISKIMTFFSIWDAAWVMKEEN